MDIPSPLEVWALSPCDAAHIFAAAFRSPPGAFKSVTLCCNLEHVVGLQANTIADA